ncbi:hypothetical protein N7492_005507 [Penicillium capsulatum]|uniref:WSC domain-containing protein n=1 Tax=Penicillium capsulatum TaxID=69766 RepID=A0A9W9LR33_9EURO|nr:hypothetical protein N7492_005507 [Penicillium capsulatum]KAJ6135392.1 hypothetical protein N7512_000552 [Penicillium capsulatum]
MHLTRQSILAASSFLLMTSSVLATPFEVLAPRGDKTFVGCFDNADAFDKKTSYNFQSSGWCGNHCSDAGSLTFGLTNKSDCLCGDSLPPSSAKVSNDKCDKSCNGWPEDMCGGVGYYSVYKTGVDDSAIKNSTSTSTSSPTKTDDAAPHVSTKPGGQTVVVTAVSDNSNVKPAQEKPKDNGPNKAAIAAGVVVGVVGATAVAGGIFFFVRSRKQKAQGFGASRGYTRESQMPEMVDSRYNGQFMAQRRQSNGSIDDDHDFSRRILQVTNPDR